jgi:hypothetical protein
MFLTALIPLQNKKATFYVTPVTPQLLTAETLQLTNPAPRTYPTRIALVGTTVASLEVGLGRHDRRVLWPDRLQKLSELIALHSTEGNRSRNEERHQRVGDLASGLLGQVVDRRGVHSHRNVLHLDRGHLLLLRVLLHLLLVLVLGHLLLVELLVGDLLLRMLLLLLLVHINGHHMVRDAILALLLRRLNIAHVVLPFAAVVYIGAIKFKNWRWPNKKYNIAYFSLWLELFTRAITFWVSSDCCSQFRRCDNLRK